MNGKQSNYGKPRKTKLDVSDVVNHHMCLQEINKRRWRFITCPGGMISNLCKACKYNDLCNQHERIEQELIKRFVDSFVEST